LTFGEGFEDDSFPNRLSGFPRRWTASRSPEERKKERKKIARPEFIGNEQQNRRPIDIGAGEQD
jgi:hypothetical protein